MATWCFPTQLFINKKPLWKASHDGFKEKEIINLCYVNCVKIFLRLNTEMKTTEVR